MNPKDREQLAEMFRERLPTWDIAIDGWGQVVGMPLPAAAPWFFTVYSHRRWRVGSDGPRSLAYGGRGWRQRLVDDVVAAVELP